MKTYITLLIALLISLSGFAQGLGMNYKAVIKDDSGNVVANQVVKVRFSVLDSDFSIEYQETHEPTTDANGIVILEIGWGDYVSGSFWSIDWTNNFYYLRTEIDTLPFDDYVAFPEVIFNSVPYAYTASKAYSAEIANNVTGLEEISEVNPETGFTQTGWRLIGRNSANYGIIGTGAVDLSYSNQDAEEEKGATGSYSTAIGFNSEASEYNSIAIGFHANASNSYATAIGNAAGASGTSSIALGYNTFATGSKSTAMGDNTSASGKNSTAIGIKTTARSYAETAIGSHNTNYIPENTLDWDENDRLFVIGNGQSPSTKKNAVTVLKNGNIGIGSDEPESLLEVAHVNGRPTAANKTNAFSVRNLSNDESWQFHSHQDGYLELSNNYIHKGSFNPNTGVYNTVSDRKAKKDITALENGTLNKVMQLNPVSYLMKEQTDTKRNLGLISQEVRMIFPSITHYVKEQDLLTLSYTELIPILIKALQEQQGIIDGQNEKIASQASENVSQDAAIASLLQRMNALETNNK